MENNLFNTRTLQRLRGWFRPQKNDKYKNISEFLNKLKIDLEMFFFNCSKIYKIITPQLVSRLLNS